MTETISHYLNRPSRYAMIDGTGEIGIGIAILGICALGILHSRAGAYSVWNSQSVVLICAVALLILVFAAEGTIKRRITYRRTGYVKYRHSGFRMPLAISAAAIIAAIAAAIVTYFLKQPARGQLLPVLLAGLSMCVLYAYATKMDDSWRWIVAVAMCMAPVATHSILANDSGQWLSTGIIGICWLSSGVTTFWLYLRKTRLTR